MRSDRLAIAPGSASAAFAVLADPAMLDKFKEECGVFGVLNHRDAANIVYLGLYALQHRGQESAGSLNPVHSDGNIGEAIGMVGICDVPGCDLPFPRRASTWCSSARRPTSSAAPSGPSSASPIPPALPPRVSLDQERALVECLLALHEHRAIRSAHDVSNGGLAVALAECAMDDFGCHVDLVGHADDVDSVALLFSESQARAVVSTPRPDDVLRIAHDHGVPAQRIGRTVAAAFVIERNGVPLIRTNASELARVWRTAFGLLLGGDSAGDVIRGVGEEAELIAH